MIPEDKNYIIVIPVSEENLLLFKENKNKMIVQSEKSVEKPKSTIDQKIFSIAALEVIILNGLPAIISDSLDSFNSISTLYKISVSKIKEYNDLDARQKLTPGNIYYLTRKRKKGKVFTYLPNKDDSLWSISQKFGIRLDNLKKLNDIQNDKLPLDKKLILRKNFWN